MGLTVFDDPTATIDLSDHFDDADDEDLTYSASSSDPAVATVDVAGDMLTITAVAAGPATITVSATDGKASVSRTFNVMVDPESNKAPTVVSGLGHDVSVMVDVDVSRDLSLYFRDKETASADLTYSADSSDDMVATASVSGTMLTIAGVADGSATITVTASDGALMVMAEFNVTVSSTPVPNVAPEVTGDGISDQSLEVEMDSEPIDLSEHFSDSDSGPNALEYVATSGDTAIATVDVSGSMLTVTAVAAGTATITVTASDGDLGATDMFDVTVTSPAAPMKTGDLGDLKFASDASPDPIMLSDYYSGADSYNVDTTPMGIVTATVEGHVLTLVPVVSGTTTVTVQPSNVVGDLGPVQSFSVTVQAKPTTKEDMEFMATIKVAAITQAEATLATTVDNADDTGQNLLAAVKRYMLDDYITDPDGEDSKLKFSTTTSDAKIVAVYKHSYQWC